GSRIHTEGATLRGVHTPGHSPDHLCFVLEEEAALFSGDNVLGVGTTVIPAGSGDLRLYMASLERLLEEAPTRIYPAHGPVIDDGPGKLREYLAHRREREAQILEALGREGVDSVPAIVAIVYAAYPRQLHAAAGQSVTSHLLKLEREARVCRLGEATPVEARWRVT
ncbi:MAG: MBL fold metallo-hydrolase, partial [Myxococcota bacterium]